MVVLQTIPFLFHRTNCFPCVAHNIIIGICVLWSCWLSSQLQVWDLAQSSLVYQSPIVSGNLVACSVVHASVGHRWLDARLQVTGVCRDKLESELGFKDEKALGQFLWHTVDVASSPGSFKVGGAREQSYCKWWDWAAKANSLVRTWAASLIPRPVMMGMGMRLIDSMSRSA